MRETAYQRRDPQSFDSRPFVVPHGEAHQDQQRQNAIQSKELPCEYRMPTHPRDVFAQEGCISDIGRARRAYGLRRGKVMQDTNRRERACDAIGRIYLRVQPKAVVVVTNSEESASVSARATRSFSERTF